MLKYLKVFLIYDLIIGILCSLGIECVNRGGLINSYFLVGLTFIIFMYIFLIPAPIVFAIKYGQRVARDQSFSFFSKLMLGFVMFTINYITYFLSHIREVRFHALSGFSPGIILDFSPRTFVPAMLLTTIYYSCIIYPKLTISVLADTKLGRLWETLKPFCAYISIVVLLILYHTYILEPYSSFGYNDFWILIMFPILYTSAPFIFGIWYGRKIAKTNLISILGKISICGFMFLANYIAYYIPYFEDKWKYYICIEKSGLFDFVKEGISYPTILLIISFIISFVVSTLFQNFKKKEAAI